MRKPAPESSGKSDQPAVVDDNLIPGIPDTLENVARALVKAPPKKPHEWKFLKREKRSLKTITDPDC